MTINRSTLATIYQAFADYITDMSIDPERLFTEAGLDFKRINDPEARFGTSEINQLWHLAKRETKNPCLVVEVVKHVKPSMLHAVGHAWVTSPTLLAAFQRCGRSHSMLSTNVEFSLTRTQGAWDLTANLKESADNTDAVIALILQMSRISYGNDLTPLEVHLIRSAPEDTSPLDDFFGCSVTYGETENRMVFSTADVQRNLRGSNPQIAAAMDDLIDTYLHQFKKTDIVGLVREVVANYLVHGEPDGEIVADELNLSPRTLQRRLNEQNSSVKKIVDSTRHQLSVSYQEQKHLSVKEIAYSLGFNDPSNFSRAFRRWEGITPKEYRKSE
jgi:AraC-like DNA-binding protein